MTMGISLVSWPTGDQWRVSEARSDVCYRRWLSILSTRNSCW
jgi:hypothetical protein